MSLQHGFLVASWSEALVYLVRNRPPDLPRPPKTAGITRRRLE